MNGVWVNNWDTRGICIHFSFIWRSPDEQIHNFRKKNIFAKTNKKIEYNFVNIVYVQDEMQSNWNAFCVCQQEDKAVRGLSLEPASQTININCIYNVCCTQPSMENTRAGNYSTISPLIGSCTSLLHTLTHTPLPMRSLTWHTGAHGQENKYSWVTTMGHFNTYKKKK